MKFVLIATIMILTIAVSGCMGGGGNDIEPDLFVGGSKSLDISFLTNNPPSQIPQNRNFNVILNTKLFF